MKMRNPGLDLVNSEHIRGLDRIDDELENPRWLERFLVRWSLPGPLSAHERARLRTLRGVLRAMVDELSNAQTVSDASLRRLHDFLPPIATRSVLERDGAGLRLVRQTEGPRHASAEVALTFAELIAGDGWRRVKACNNPHCRWAYYDESRNRSRRWCDSAECGNVMKVRAFRKRRGEIANG
ncbi:MAG TPA: CGNR zinc finger domain-containing protein [Telluria sp.]|nr:CGNR zinc finger domain-containing protein [Telluria sp.]